ncbi:hypothetical protein [Streptomyces canus]
MGELFQLRGRGVGRVLPNEPTLDRLRQDRILDEAFATGDPLSS